MVYRLQGGNRIGPAGGRHIASAVKVNSSLLTLDISNNLLGPSGCCCIGMSLSFNTTLQDVSISGNNGGDGCTSFFAEAIKWQGRLKQPASLCGLDLSDNGISDAGATALVQALGSNTTMTRLSLGGDGLSVSSDLVRAVGTIVGGNRQVVGKRGGDVAEYGTGDAAIGGVKVPPRSSVKAQVGLMEEFVQGMLWRHSKGGGGEGLQQAPVGDGGKRQELC